MADDKIVMTKRLSKMGDNVILVIPKDLKGHLDHGDLVEVSMNVLSKGKSAKPKKPKKETVKPSKKIMEIVSSLKEKGYSKENISAVLVKNGYAKKEVDAALKK